MSSSLSSPESPAHTDTFSNQVSVCQHPLAKHQLSLLRNRETSVESFRRAMTQIGRLLVLEATRDLPTATVTVETPLQTTTCETLSPEAALLIVPILRAGLSLSEAALELFPMAMVCHLGLYRDEETCLPVTYYHRLPETVAYKDAQLLITDPMLATGGSAVAAVDILKKQGAQGKNMRFISVIAAPEGIQKLLAAHPDINIYTGAVDERLNERSYIIPGLGDAGDRTFGTI